MFHDGPQRCSANQPEQYGRTAANRQSGFAPIPVARFLLLIVHEYA
jgi:hypothetical protein